MEVVFNLSKSTFRPDEMFGGVAVLQVGKAF